MPSDLATEAAGAIRAKWLVHPRDANYEVPVDELAEALRPFFERAEEDGRAAIVSYLNRAVVGTTAGGQP